MRFAIKHIIVPFMAMLSLLCVCSCGEDRTYEYEEKTAAAHAIYTNMKDWYLWGDSLKEPDWKSFFLSPDEFLTKLKSVSKVSDSWTHCEYDTAVVDYHERGNFSHVDSYGMDYTLMTDPTGSTTRSYLRVTYVVEGSPADECGLARNSFIGYIDGERVSSSNSSKLQNGKAHTLVVYGVGYSEDSLSYEWKTTDTLEISPSRYVEEKVFTASTIIEFGSHKMAYLMCARMCSDSRSDGQSASVSYESDLNDAMSYFKSNNVDEMILDLRLCNYGDKEMLVKLASRIIPASALGSECLKTQWNSTKSANNETLCYESDASYNLGLQRVFIVTSTYTQGAAEWLIKALRATMGDENVITAGVRTAGQNVELSSIEMTGYPYSLSLVTAFVADKNGDYDYAEGIEPDLSVNEYDGLELNPYGNSEETVVRTIIQAIEESEK